MPSDSIVYYTLRQSADDVRDPDNAPAVSMPVYLVAIGEEERFRRVSIYAERGSSPQELRLLYFNAEALAVWRAMGRNTDIVGERHRPPRSALLAFGVPFSE